MTYSDFILVPLDKMKQPCGAFIYFPFSPGRKLNCVVINIIGGATHLFLGNVPLYFWELSTLAVTCFILQSLEFNCVVWVIFRHFPVLTILYGWISVYLQATNIHHWSKRENMKSRLVSLSMPFVENRRNNLSGRQDSY